MIIDFIMSYKVKMKKVAIVSCYFQHNYGSMLQAYATQRVLDKIGYENESINITGFNKEIKKAKVKYFIKAAVTSDILISKVGMVKNKIRQKVFKGKYAYNTNIRNQKFDEFKQNYFRLSEEYASKKELMQLCDKLYSAVLVGSDQLWLPANIVADYYTLNFVPNTVNTIAYSTSFGQSSLPKDIQKKAAVFLKEIRHIGVREESGQKLVEDIVGRKVPVVCDPTLLLDEQEWNIIQEQEPIIEGKYILCYFLGNNLLHRQFAKKLKEETGYKIIALTHLDEFVKNDEGYADMQPYNIGPSEFLNLIRYSSYVCTDSFHCSVFSMLYKKSFFSFRRYTRKTMNSTNSRLDTLFKIAGIDDGIFKGDENIQECVKRAIDYDKVHSKLKRLREESYSYLIKALEDEGSTDCD